MKLYLVRYIGGRKASAIIWCKDVAELTKLAGPPKKRVGLEYREVSGPASIRWEYRDGPTVGVDEFVDNVLGNDYHEAFKRCDWDDNFCLYFGEAVEDATWTRFVPKA